MLELLVNLSCDIWNSARVVIIQKLLQAADLLSPYHLPDEVNKDIRGVDKR